MNLKKIKKPDYKIICEIVKQDASVLDLGCGDGELLSILVQNRNAKVQGIEIDDAAIRSCVEKGLTVFHSDIDSGLPYYPDHAFDYVILNQSVQQVKRVEFVIQECLRVAKNVIIGFPNFAHVKARLSLLLNGTAPVTSDLPYLWYSTPNLRFLSIQDFQDYCISKGISIYQSFFYEGSRRVLFFPNVFASNAIFVIGKLLR